MKKSIAALSLLLLAMVSCKQNDQKIEGDGYAPDDIGLSTKTVTFDKAGGEKVISTKGDIWSICSFVDFQTLKFIKNAISSTVEDETVFLYDGISVQKNGRKGLKISVVENTTGQPQKIAIQVTSGNYFDDIQIMQKAD